ncbi:tetratricopeptide repeat protein [Striga asiatica]|uniref:Tetratricopeptide repeat protein n=1 Tax=Striga asiatica TaxID=4170 RepID=A0A5A7P7Q6_STRAF|nr:tetratricopeptide repeat protein [Striga asiatica]
MRLAAMFSRAVRLSLVKLPSPPPAAVAAPKPVRRFSTGRGAFTPNPVALEMIKYAASLAREQKTEESYARGLLVLEQCESIQPDGNSKGLVELARATLLCEKGSHERAIEGLGKIQDLNLSSIAIKVAASEALVGIYLEHYREDAASAVADLALQTLETIRLEIGDGGGFEVLEARIRALKGLIELICGNLDSAQSIFEGAHGEGYFVGNANAALCYGEYLHGTRKFSSAKKLYTTVIQSLSQIKDFSDPNNFGACNMTSEEVSIAAACALGQLEAHMGNFSDAEEILTAALKKMEEHFGPHHPKIGVVLTCIALMYRLKATAERSSSLLVQEGLFRRALELLKAPPLDVDGASENIRRKDIITLARGGYAEALAVQLSRKVEAEKLRKWAEGCWGNRWIPLGEALELTETSAKFLVIDTRICRAV